MFGFKVAGLIPVPDKTGKFGNRCLSVKTVDIANFSDDAGRVDLANAGNGCQRIWDNLKVLLNGFVQHLDLFLQRPHGSDRDGHGLIHSVVHCLWQTVGPSGRSLHCFGSSIRVNKSASACFGNKGRQLVQISICKVVHSLKVFHECNRGGTGILNVLVLSDTRAFEK